MKTWKQYILLNLSAALGIFVSLFVVPENTTIQVWAAVSIIVVVLVNVGLHLQRRSSEGKKWNRGTAMIWAGFLLLVMDALFSRTLLSRMR